jgi:hypothetical protein
MNFIYSISNEIKKGQEDLVRLITLRGSAKINAMQCAKFALFMRNVYKEQNKI